MSNKNYKVLIVDDEPEFHLRVRTAFRQNFVFEGAVNEHRLQQKLESDEHFDLILLDLILDENNQTKTGLTLIPSIINHRPSTPVIIVTNENKIQKVIEAIKLGAFSFLYKGDFEIEYWQNTFYKAIESVELKKECKSLKKELFQVKQKYEYRNPTNSPLLGNSAAMEYLRKTLKTLADAPDMTVLITGETGVGKGVAARFLHYNSIQRSDKPFEEIHISNITKNLLESNLFGAKKGSFTGANEDIKGRLEMADKGIVFLDEIGDLDMESQVKLLQFVQTKTIRPIGWHKDIHLDVQIVAATNKNLREQVAKGQFREDLYQRLKVFPIEIPPLRERREDILELLLYFNKFGHRDELKENYQEDVIQFLVNDYGWIGNVRELENTVKGVQIRRQIMDVPRVNMACLPDDMLKNKPQISLTRSTTISSSQTDFSNQSVTSSHTMNVDEQTTWTTMQAIEQAFQNTGSKSQVAKMLDFKSADSLRYRVLTSKNKYPHFFKSLPNICKKYKISINA